MTDETESDGISAEMMLRRFERAAKYANHPLMKTRGVFMTIELDQQGVRIKARLERVDDPRACYTVIIPYEELARAEGLEDGVHRCERGILGLRQQFTSKRKRG